MNWKEKFTSRKFLLAAGGLVGGILLACMGSVTEGVTAAVTSVVGYLAAEGLIDLAAVRSSFEEK